MKGFVFRKLRIIYSFVISQESFILRNRIFHYHVVLTVNCWYFLSQKRTVFFHLLFLEIAFFIITLFWTLIVETCYPKRRTIVVHLSRERGARVRACLGSLLKIDVPVLNMMSHWWHIDIINLIMKTMMIMMISSIWEWYQWWSRWLVDIIDLKMIMMTYWYQFWYQFDSDICDDNDHDWIYKIT